jgi:hypothetical protein
MLWQGGSGIVLVRQRYRSKKCCTCIRINTATTATYVRTGELKWISNGNSTDAICDRSVES